MLEATNIIKYVPFKRDTKNLMSQDEKKYKISFPQMGNYQIPIYRFLMSIIDIETTEVLMPKKISTNTITKGAKASPDFVCVPFKYNMGNYIEALDKGANVLIQAGGGCRYGFYAEVQEQILKDMGYEFTYISLMDGNGIDISAIYPKFLQLNPKLKWKQFVWNALIAIKSIALLDEIETYIRHHLAYERKIGLFERIHQEFLIEIGQIQKMGDIALIKKKYKKMLSQVPLKNEEEKKAIIKIGIVGELYTSMEPFSSFFLERELAKLGCQVRRYTTVTYLLFQKSAAQKKLLKKASSYISYTLGADGAESVAHTIELAKEGYDGIIHIKPFGCTPEINAMPMLQKISQDYEIPIMYLTFDSQTSETGIKTRIEAFYDMLWMKKENLVSRNTRYV